MGKFVMIDRTGETNIAKNGQKMTIVACRGARDIDIEFEDGTLLQHKRYDLFLNGTVCNPNVPRPNTGRHNTEADRHIGKTKISKIGQKMTIVGYRNKEDVDIQVDDVLYEHVAVRQFTNGVIGTRSGSNHHLFKDHSGEVNYNTLGLRMIIVNYRNYNDIDVQFDDGVIIEHRSYHHFREGTIDNPNFSRKNYLSIRHIGERSISSNGVGMQITEYAGSLDITIQFDTGCVLLHKHYYDFQHSKYRHPLPYTIGDITMTKLAYTYNGVGNFFCHCTKCGVEDIFTVDEIKNHKC